MFLCYFSNISIPVAQECRFPHSHFFHLFFFLHFHFIRLLPYNASFQFQKSQLLIFAVPECNLYAWIWNDCVIQTFEFISLYQFLMLSYLIPAPSISQSWQGLQTSHQDRIWTSASLSYRIFVLFDSADSCCSLFTLQWTEHHFIPTKKCVICSTLLFSVVLLCLDSVVSNFSFQFWSKHPT